ncbi:MAG: cullin [archaeon]|nr:cullin [archaeon]
MPMLSQVMNQNRDITQVDFLNQYRLVFNLVKLEMKARQVIQALQVFFKNFLTSKVVPALQTTRSPLDFLTVYASEWSKYAQSSKWLTFVFKPLDQGDLSDLIQLSEPRPQRVPVKMWECWKSEIYATFRDRLQSAITGAILADRRGEGANLEALKTVVGSYADLGQDTPPYDTLGNDFYVSEFLDRFLGETCEFYTLEAAEFIGRNSVTAFLRWAIDKLNFEKSRTPLYHFDHISNSKHSSILNQAIIQAYRDKIMSVLPQLLEERQEEDLHRLYYLLNRVNELFAVIEQFFTHLVSAAKALYTELLPEFQSLAQTPANRIPFSVKYVESFMGFYSTFSQIVHKSFEGNPRLESSFLRACREALNNNAINPAGSTAYETASFTSLYSHHILSDKALDIDAVQAKLKHIITIYNFLEAKDAFHLFYQRYYRTRLLSHAASSPSCSAGFTARELAMQAELAKVAPWDFMNSLDRMHQDIEYSCAHLRPGFQEFLWQNPAAIPECPSCTKAISLQPAASSSTTERAELVSYCSLTNPSRQLSIDFAASVLTLAAWPLESDELSIPFQLPPELHFHSHQFVAFYESVHRSRTLEWIHEKSRAEIETEWLPKTYHITTNHFQLSVLLFFNRIPRSWDGIASFGDLRESLGMDPRHLSVTLAVLCRIGLMQKQPVSAQAPFSDQIRFRLGRQFSQTRTDLDVALLWKKPVIEVEEDPAELVVINKQRDMCTQAAIVRIMKARKELSHQKLVDAVSDQTQVWFPTMVGRIKTQIDFLINHNPPFLERIDAKTYRYVA